MRHALILLSPMQYAFGRTLGNWILLPPQLIVLVGLGITYTCAPAPGYVAEPCLCLLSWPKSASTLTLACPPGAI